MNVMKDFANNDLKEEPRDGKLQKEILLTLPIYPKSRGRKAATSQRSAENGKATPGRKSLETASKRCTIIRELLFRISEEELALCLELMEQSRQLFSWPSWKSKRDLVSLLASVIKAH
jgi:hypothetical protein